MLNREFPNFDCKRFEDEVFENNRRDPYGQRMQNIRSWADIRQHYGLSTLRCDEWLLRQGYMSAPLHECLERTLGKERLASYFPTEVGKQKTGEKDEIEELATLLFGTVRENSEIRNRRK